MNPYSVTNSALAGVPIADQEKALFNLAAISNLNDHALQTRVLLRLVTLLSSRVSYLEAQVQGRSNALSFHSLDV